MNSTRGLQGRFKAHAIGSWRGERCAFATVAERARDRSSFAYWQSATRTWPWEQHANLRWDARTHPPTTLVLDRGIESGEQTDDRCSQLTPVLDGRLRSIEGPLMKLNGTFNDSAPRRSMVRFWPGLCTPLNKRARREEQVIHLSGGAHRQPGQRSRMSRRKFIKDRRAPGVTGKATSRCWLAGAASRIFLA